jgi:hypothetical protein
MWIVYDWSDGLIGIFDNYEEAEKQYQGYKEHNQTYTDGEFDGEEEVILAKIDKRFFARDTGKPVMKEDEEGNEVPTKDTWWEWKEDVNNLNHPELSRLVARNLVAWDTSKDKREGLLPEVYISNKYWYKQLTGEEYFKHKAIKKFNIE